MPGSTAVLPCPTADRGAALNVLYRRVPEGLRPRLVADALDEADRGLIDLSGLWVARRRGGIVGALLTQPLAGRAAAVWAPEVDIFWGRGEVAGLLVRAALDHLRVRGFRIAQALIDGSSPRQGAADLTRGGLPRVTDLVYLARETATPLAIDPALPRFAWRSYGPSTAAEFATILRETYVGSLDMPELDGIRALDDVLASHRAAGQFDPDRWQVGRLEFDPDAAAIVLLSDLPDRDAWEVAYLGLTPAARGRGLGRAALVHALDLARPRTPRLELAVDARNVPADRLYSAAGFAPFDRRAVHLATF